MASETLPNYTELGLIAEACYPKGTRCPGSSRDIGSAWHEVKNHSLHTSGSFYCRLYHHQQSNKYVLAVAGTELFTRTEDHWSQSLLSTVGDIWQDLKVMLDKRPTHVDHVVRAAKDILTAKEKELGRPLSSHDVDAALCEPNIAHALTFFSGWLSGACGDMTVFDDLGFAKAKYDSNMLTHKCQVAISDYNFKMKMLHRSPVTQKIREEVRALVHEPGIKKVNYFVGHSLGGILIKYTVNELARKFPFDRFYGVAFNSPDVFASNGYSQAPNARLETVYHPLDPVTAAGSVTLGNLVSVLKNMALGGGKNKEFKDSKGVPLTDNNPIALHPKDLKQICQDSVTKSFMNHKRFFCALEDNLYAEIKTIVQRLSTLHTINYINEMVMHQQVYRVFPIGEWQKS